MKRKTKSFFWGTVAGAALLIVVIIGIVASLYYNGAGVLEEKQTQKKMAEAEQIQRFNATCANAVPEAMVYLLKTLAPALNAYEDGRVEKEALIALNSGIKNKADFLSHCATRIAVTNESSHKHSMQLMSASSALSTVSAFLNGLRFPNCEPVCQQDLVRRAKEASTKLENVLRGDKRS